ncbi:flavin reductase like domain-containing protein [Triangularia verruculosa]|uniref:Flavin reductase like domain-containing protein n=1 Tax=Triangularia verruculosa TaxID=2587418 RepID=A0AAN7AVU1_9PEZI|nr:flavin reductase like domain-containing protein [Triangularia verruculosa]
MNCRLPTSTGLKAAAEKCSNSAFTSAVSMSARPISRSLSMRRLCVQSQHIHKGHVPPCTVVPVQKRIPIQKPTPHQHEQHRAFTTNPRPLRSFITSPPQPPSIHPHSSLLDPTPLPEQLRSLMRLITHSVVVCTSSSGPTPRAMTMSSFTSLSLRPTPIISFNIATPSRTFDAVSASKHFNIHVLSDDPSGARIADWLARGNAAGLEVFEQLRQECGCGYETGKGREAPVIRGPGVLYVLRCELLEEPMGGLVKVRDHYIVLGEVKEIVEVNGGGKEEKFGLMYADRKYRELGGCIVPGEGLEGGKDGEEQGL